MMMNKIYAVTVTRRDNDFDQVNNLVTLPQSIR